MRIAIDVGNTFVKIGYFKNHLLEKKLVLPINEIIWSEIVSSKTEAIIVSASGNLDQELVHTISSLSAKTHFLTHKSLLPILIKYKTPHTLGLDRIAGAAGCHTLFENKKNLIIDAGTAITYDFLDKNSFLGGNISPGLSLRYRSLNEFTARLPLGKTPEEPKLYGTNTDEAIDNGVFNGTLYEIEETIFRFQEEYSEINIVLTGGDAHFFANKIKKTIFAEPNLVLIGLNRILSYNV